MDTETTPLNALIEAMVISAQLAGGLTPERADVLLTILLEHPLFAHEDEDDLRTVLACTSEDIHAERLAELAPQLHPQAQTAFQLMFLVASAQPPSPEAALLQAAATLGLDDDTARAIMAAGIPPELDILTAGPLPEEVYLDVLLAAAAADGHLAPEELDALVAFASDRLELRLLPRSEIGDLMQASLQGFLDYGVDVWLETLPDALPLPEQRQTAYRLAADMVAADHIIKPTEEAFLRRLQAVLHLA